MSHPTGGDVSGPWITGTKNSNLAEELVLGREKDPLPIDLHNVCVLYRHACF